MIPLLVLLCYFEEPFLKNKQPSISSVQPDLSSQFAMFVVWLVIILILLRKLQSWSAYNKRLVFRLCYVFVQKVTVFPVQIHYMKLVSYYFYQD